jgi:putative hydrolase
MLEVSDDRPDDRDPFRGLPIFGDLAKLFQQQGPMSWDAARQLAHAIATDGEPETNVDPVARMAFEQLARVAELQVGTATGLVVSPTGRGITIVPVTRSQWAQRSLEAYRPHFERLAGSLQGPATELPEPAAGDPMGWMAPMLQMIAPMMLGMTAGSMVGHLARRVFGQYDLPIPRATGDELLVVLANVDEFGRAWSLPDDDLRLWVCLQEVATHAVLSLPHVRARLDDLLARYLSGFEPDSTALEDRLGAVELDPSGMPDMQSLLGDPEVLLGAIQSPLQRELLPRLEAIVAAVVGYVDHVMDEIGAGLVSSYGMVTEAVRRRRVEESSSDRFVARLFGLELTQAQYDRGSRFVDGIAQRAGAEGLARLWEDERTLPTPAEVDAPGLWLARIDIPDEPA